MKDFIELISDNAKNYPERIAVIDGERKINYADFFNLVNSISHQLLLKNETPKVVFDLKQGFEAYALIVAILNVGGTYCPINYDVPSERKIQIIDQFEPNIIVTEIDSFISNSQSAYVLLNADLVNNKNITDIIKTYNENDIIYVIYTSGSTGISKGVKICRKALNKFLEWSIPTYKATENDLWGQFSNLSFDLSVVDIFTCLCSGATLYSMNNISAKKYRPSKEIETAKITIWHSIPSVVEFMIKNEDGKKYDFSSLRLLSFCGEPLKKHQVEFLFKKKKDLIIFNTYGPTEGTLFCTWQELNKKNYQEYFLHSMSIGQAIPGWNLKLNTIKGIEEKEIIIYGKYIGKGYLRNPTDSKFKLIEVDGKQVESFETGDLVIEHKGNLYFSCRKDRQVKIKGYRIELDEIDFRITEFLNKTSITVVKNETLYSFIETEEKVNKQELREFLKVKLESFKIPNEFYTIDEIPRNQNQKVDNNKLIQLIP